MSIAITEEQFKEFQGYKKGYYRLKEENNNLQEKANQLLTSKNELWKEVEETQSKVDEMYEFSYFKKLKKAEAEIKKLKEENEDLVKAVKPLVAENKKLKRVMKDSLHHMPSMQEEIDKLTEENKKLKEELIQKIESHLSEQERDLVAMKRMNKENKELKEEIEKLKRVIKEYEEDEPYMYDVKDENTTYYLGDDLDEARKQSEVSGVEIKRYIVEDGEPNFGDWDIVH